MFAIPLNAKYRHFNGSGQKRALMVCTTNMPMIMNIFHNENFIFNNSAVFADRMGKDEYYNGEGDLTMVRPGNHMWETNFVPDLENLELHSWEDRGAGSSNIMFVLADSSMHAHISEMVPGTYKKAHRHGPGAHVMCVVGTGFSLLWFEGQKDYLRVDWKHGVLFPPADRQLHQHFNTSNRNARYLATNVGGIRYPLTAASRRSGGGDEQQEASGVAEHQGRRRPDRIRGSGSAYPSAVGVGDEEARLPDRSEDVQVVPARTIPGGGITARHRDDETARLIAGPFAFGAGQFGVTPVCVVSAFGTCQRFSGRPSARAFSSRSHILR